MTAVAEHVVARAARGDQAAWDQLVDRYAGLVWAVARGHRLAAPDAADVVQTTWLKLLEHLGGIREPDRLGAWLATTARRESLGVLRRAGRQVPTADAWAEVEDAAPGPEARAVAADRDRVLRAAVARLPDRCRILLRVLMADPPPTYDEVAAALGMPIGSIGPTRARCLARLRTEAERAGLPDPS